LSLFDHKWWFYFNQFSIKIPTKEINMDALTVARTALKSQYHTSLEMLSEAIERCPEELWLDTNSVNAFWQVAYHALFYVHMYLQPNLEAFTPWAEHQTDVQYQNGFPGPAKAGSKLPLIPSPYSKTQVQTFIGICDAMVDAAIDNFDLLEPKSGFPWYTCSKLEHQIISIRHLQHHTAQLGDRLRAAGGVGLTWLGHA
jgi:hypothetical protein